MSESFSMLFVCSGNSCRSQMAEAFARQLGKGKIESFSAGTAPKPLDASAVAAMERLGVDISRAQPKSLDTYRGRRFDFVVSLCERSNEDCASWPDSGERMRWSVDDPSDLEGNEDARRRAYDAAAVLIRQRIQMFLVAYKVL